MQINKGRTYQIASILKKVLLNLQIPYSWAYQNILFQKYKVN